jgi:hypothetical protein
VEIGKPKRTFTSEPIEDPVPRRLVVKLVGPPVSDDAEGEHEAARPEPMPDR